MVKVEEFPPGHTAEEVNLIKNLHHWNTLAMCPLEAHCFNGFQKFMTENMCSETYSLLI